MALMDNLQHIGKQLIIYRFIRILQSRKGKSGKIQI